MHSRLCGSHACGVTEVVDVLDELESPFLILFYVFLCAGSGISGRGWFECRFDPINGVYQQFGLPIDLVLSNLCLHTCSFNILPNIYYVIPISSLNSSEWGFPWGLLNSQVQVSIILRHATEKSLVRGHRNTANSGLKSRMDSHKGHILNIII